jgi:uncharacterized protein YgiM (DUF1202 family)
MNIKRITIIIILLFLLIVCKKDNQWTIDLPETRDIANLNQWAFVVKSNSKLRQEPSVNSDVINYINIGSMMQIIKKDDKLSTFNTENDYWYYVDYEGERGWIFGTYIEIYNTYEEAEKKCIEMLTVLAKKEEEKNNGKEKKH